GPSGDRTGGDRTGRNVLDDLQSDGHLSQVVGQDRVSVHRGVGERRQGGGSDHRFGEDPTACLRQVHFLGAQCANAAQNLGPSFFQWLQSSISLSRAMAARACRFSSRSSLLLIGRNRDSGPLRGTRTNRMSRCEATSLISRSNWMAVPPSTFFSTMK